MWATYGQNHAGICFVIDDGKFKEENAELIKEYNIIDGKVEYNYDTFRGIPSTQSVVGLENLKKTKNITWQDLKNDDYFIKRRFFTKNPDWEGEFEYRFLTFSRDNNDIMLSIKDSLTMVICGIRFSKYYAPALINLFSKDKIYTIDPNLDMGGNFRIERIDPNNVWINHNHSSRT